MGSWSMGGRVGVAVALALVGCRDGGGDRDAGPECDGAPCDAGSDEDRWVPTGGPPGGPIFVMAFDPDDPDTLYAGGRGGRLFVSDDAGAEWRATPVFAPQNRDVTELLVHADAPDTSYALALYDGLYVSRDGTATWQTAFHPAETHLDRAAMSVADPQQLIVAGPGVVAITMDGAESFVDVSGAFPPDVPVLEVAAGAAGEFWVATGRPDGTLYRSTDGGASWTAADLRPVQPSGTRVFDLWVDPEDPGRLFVGLFFASNLGGNPGDASLLRTVDGGTSWDAVTLPGPPVGGVIAGRDPSTGALYASSFMDLYRSADGGDSWETLGLPDGIMTIDPTQVLVDPRDADVLYLPTRAEGVAKSSDGGESWRAINRGINASTNPLLATPRAGGLDGTLYVAGLPGLFRSDDRGATWRQLDEPDIFHPFFDEVVVSPHDPDEVWVVTDAGHLFVSEDRGDSWSLEIDSRQGGTGFRFGSIYAMAPAPSDADTIYALKAGFGIFRSRDGGSTWTFLRNSEVDYSYTLAVAPMDPNVVFSGSNPKPFQDFGMVRRSLDGGDSWETVLRLEGADGVTSVAIDGSDPSTVYAGAPSPNGGLLRVSHDGGETWDALGGLDFTNIHAMATIPSDPAGAVAALWGGGVYHTVDRGLSWFEIDAPTPSASSVMTGGVDGSVLYLADRNAPRIYRTSIPSSSPWDEWETVLDAGDDYYRVLTATVAGGESDVVYASVLQTRGNPTEGSLFRIGGGGVVDVTHDLPVLPVALAVDSTEPDRVYAVLHGAGSGVHRLDGESWTPIAGAGSGIPQTPPLGFSGIVVAGSRLYLFGGSDAYFAGGTIAHTGAAPSDLFTVYRSDDGGSTWTNLDDGHFGARSGPIKGIAVDPAAPDTLFVAAERGVFSSADGGSSWTDVSAGLGYLPASGVALSADGLGVYVPTLGGGMFVGTVAAGTTVDWTEGSRLAADVDHVLLSVDPADSSVVLASGYPGGVFASADSGATWQERNFGLPSFVVDDPLRQGYYAVAIAPSNPDAIYLGLYGVGVYRSLDGAATWLAASGEGGELSGAPVATLAVDPGDASHVFVGTEDGIFETVDAGASWTPFDAGLDSTDVRVLSVDASGRLLAGTRGYEIYASPSTHADFSQLGAFDNWGAIWPIWDDRPLYQYTSVLFHPEDPNVVYMGTFPAGIFRSEDGGGTWREANVGWTNDGVFSLRAHPRDPDIIYAGTYNGLNRSVDGGRHWHTWDAGWPAEQWVFSIDFDPRDSNVMYACSKNGQNEGRGSELFNGTVMKSVDGGTSWYAITDGLEVSQELYAVVVDPHAPDTVYLATQRDGVWISRDGGEDGWVSWSEGLDNPFSGSNGNNVTSNLVLSSDRRLLYYGTAGSGVYRRRIAE